MNWFGLGMGGVVVLVAWVSIPVALGLMMYGLFELTEDKN